MMVRGRQGAVNRIVFRWRCAVAVLALVAAVGPACAQDDGPDWKRCRAGDPDVVIAGCSAVLAAGNGLPAQRAVAAMRRGYAYTAKRQYDRALADFDEATRLDPNSADAFAGRGFMNQRLGHHDRAIEDFDQAIRLRPSFHAAFVGRAAAEFAIQDYDAAIADFSRALELRPRDSGVLVGRGRAYDAKRDDD